MKRYAILSCVRETEYQPQKYPHEDTLGVDKVTKSLYSGIVYKFGTSNVSYFSPNAKRSSILNKLEEVRQSLDSDGLLFFYFHGHGDSMESQNPSLESRDQFLVCSNEILIDNTIDIKISGFKPTQRIFSIVDSCSSETVVEWKKFPWTSYPQVIHVASSRDNGYAYSNINGGLLSQKIVNQFLLSGLYWGMSYRYFLTQMRTSIDVKSFIGMTKNTEDKFLDKKMFD